MKDKLLNDLIVVKRSGQRVTFNAPKIAIAIKNAFDSIYEGAEEKKINKVYERVLEYIENNYHDRKTINVEDIQDIIEDMLKIEKCLNVYQSFNEYRQKRAASRKVFLEKQQHKFVKAIEKIVQENNFKGHKHLCPNSVLYKFGHTVSSEYAKSYILDSKHIRAHDEGSIYIHDLDYFSLGIIPCIHLILKQDLLVDNYLDDLLYNIIHTNNEVNNEISINALDYILESWAINIYRIKLKDVLEKNLNLVGLLEYINIKKVIELIDKEESIPIVLDNYEQFILNKNVYNLFNLTLDFALEYVKEEITKVLNKFVNVLDKDCNPTIKYTVSFGTNQQSFAGRLINNILLGIIEKKTFTKVNFIIKLKTNIQPKTIMSLSDLIIKNKNILLSFSSNQNDETYKEIEYFENGMRVYENINNNEKSSQGRMVINSTSINMARLGFNKFNKQEFFNEFNEMLELVKNELLLSFEIIGNKFKENYHYLFHGNVAEDEKLEINQKIRKVIKNNVLSIGLIGLKECILSMEPDEDKQYLFLMEILTFANKKCQEFSEETKITFTLYEPSDYKSRRDLITIDKTIYGSINPLTNQNYYDLIFNLKVLKNDYKKLSEIQKLFSGGELIVINLSDNTTSKHMIDILTELIKSNIDFVKIKIGK